MNLLQQTDVFGVCSLVRLCPWRQTEGKRDRLWFRLRWFRSRGQVKHHFATEGPVASSCMVVPQVITCHPATSDGKMLQLTGFNAKACTCAGARARAGTCANACWGPCVVKHGRWKFIQQRYEDCQSEICVQFCWSEKHDLTKNEFWSSYGSSSSPP